MVGLDLIEAVRPHVDGYLLDLLEQRTFRASDFYESPRGICRLLSPTTRLLAETSATWAQLIAPITERTAQTLAQAPGSRIERLSTPLANTKRHAGRAAMRRRPVSAPASTKPKFPAACRRCGGGKDPPHGADAAAARAAANVERKRQVQEWDERYGKLTDLSAFQREILPAIQSVPLSRLHRATGLSLRYVSQIRRGEKTPPPTPLASSPRHSGLVAGASRTRRAPQGWFV